MNISLKIDVRVGLNAAATDQPSDENEQDENAEPAAVRIKVPKVEVNQMFTEETVFQNYEPHFLAQTSKVAPQIFPNFMDDNLATTFKDGSQKFGSDDASKFSETKDQAKIPEINVQFWDSNKFATMPKGQNLMKPYPLVNQNQFEDSTQCSSAGLNTSMQFQEQQLSPNMTQNTGSLEQCLMELDKEGFSETSSKNPSEGQVKLQTPKIFDGKIKINCLVNDLASIDSRRSTQDTKYEWRMSDPQNKSITSDDFSMEYEESSSTQKMCGQPIIKLNQLIGKLDFTNVFDQEEPQSDEEELQVPQLTLNTAPKIEINLGNNDTSLPTALEMDSLLDNLTLQFKLENKVNHQKSKKEKTTINEWLENDGLIRPILAVGYLSEVMEVIESDSDQGDSDFEREDDEIDNEVVEQQRLELMAPIPLQRQRGQIFRTFDVNYALG